MIQGLLRTSPILPWRDRLREAWCLLRTGRSRPYSLTVEAVARSVCKWEHTHWYGFYELPSFPGGGMPEPIQPCGLAYDFAMRLLEDPTSQVDAGWFFYVRASERLANAVWQAVVDGKVDARSQMGEAVLNLRQEDKDRIRLAMRQSRP